MKRAMIRGCSARARHSSRYATYWATLAVVCGLALGWSPVVAQDEEGVVSERLVRLNLYSRERADAKIEEINTLIVIEDRSFLIDQIKTLDLERARAATAMQRARTTIATLEKATPEPSREEAAMVANLRGLAQKPCNARTLEAIRSAGQELNFVTPSGSRLEDLGQRLATVADCGLAHQLLVGLPDEARLKEDARTANMQEREALKSGIDATTRVIAALTNRMQANQKRMTEADAKAKKADKFAQNDLWILVMVLGCFSLGLLFIVKTFELSVQMELVRSGQVIQFLTVMVLLTAILTLGFLERISDQVLGTLLGGIGGYVLAQGVGKLARQDESQKR